jgi:hypothetical protein
MSKFKTEAIGLEMQENTIVGVFHVVLPDEEVSIITAQKYARIIEAALRAADGGRVDEN